MPQLSLCIDKDTLRELEIAAAIEGLSISKYVVKKLIESIHKKWPENYDQLFGSVNDEVFVAEAKNSFKNDTTRDSF